MAQGLFNLKQVNQAIQQGGWSAQTPPQVEYLVVAGGGAGGGGAGYAGGGGGAGGLLAGMDIVPNGQALLVTIGAGGVADPGTDNGTSGGNSVFGQIIAVGGGRGSAGQGGTAATGGSGGGGGGNGGRVGQGTSGQGFSGGLGYGAASGSAGGGGGAGSAGYPVGNSYFYAGNGGVGVASAITGTVTTYAGGGGGSATSGAVGGAGGLGGGGAGATGSGVGSAGTANTGGGGGGSGNMSTRIAGNGGSGIVAISYPDTYAAAASTTGSPTISTSGSGSLSFDGSSQYLTYASNAAWALGSTFTLEFWTYPTAFSSNNKRFFDTSNNGAGGFSLRTTNTGVVALDVTATGQTNTTLSLNTWTHVAVVVTSGVLTIYFDGVSQGLTGTTTGINVTGTLGLTVCNFGTASTYAYQGYMTNIRVVKGVAVYTGNFTPSIVPLQATQPAGTNIAAITSTSTGLLLNSVSGSSCADISTNGFGATSSPTIAPTWNALSPFTVTGYKNRVYRWTSSGSITF